MQQNSDIARAAQRLLEGKLVAFPTETVYGLGADARNPQAVERIYAFKGRPSNHPVIVHLAFDADLSYWAKEIPHQVQALVKTFWPGPLTLILKRADAIPDQVSGGQDTIGLRCPSHPVARTLLQAFSTLKGGHGGVAAPSANKFGQVSPTRAAHVRDEFPMFGDDDLMILEGGAADVGIESTILDVSRMDAAGPVLLRPGHITANDIGKVMGVRPLVQADATAPRVSGSLKAHYAPHTPLALLPRRQIEALLFNQAADVAYTVFQDHPLRMVKGRFAVLGIGPEPVSQSGLSASWLPAARQPHGYARDLYANLRELDQGEFDFLIVEDPPATEAWQAIRDRLNRAAAAFGQR